MHQAPRSTGYIAGIAALTGSFTISRAEAQTIFSNLGPVGSGYGTANSVSSTVYRITRPKSPSGAVYLGFQFTPTVTATVAEIDVPLAFVGVRPNIISLFLHVDSGMNTLGAALAAATAFAVQSSSDPPASLTVFTPAAQPTLTAGDHYWMFLLPYSGATFDWGSDNSGAAGLSVSESGGDLSYSYQSSEDGGFQILGPAGASTPEPGSIALIGALLSFGGCLACRRRNRIA